MADDVERLRPSKHIQETVQKREERTPVEQAVVQRKRAETFEKLKREMRNEAKLRRKSAGRSPVEHEGDVFEAGRDSQVMISDAIRVAKRYNENNSDDWESTWKLEDGSFRSVTQSDLQTVFQKIEMQVESAYGREAEINSEIDSASSISDLEDIDMKAGWP